MTSQVLRKVLASVLMIGALSTAAEPALAYASGPPGRFVLASEAAAPAIPDHGNIDALKDWLAGGLIAAANVFVNVGASIVTNRIIQAGTAAKNIGWGTGTTAAAVTDTALQTEVAPTTSGGRTVGTESRTTVTVTNDNYQVTGTVTQNQTGPVAITEAGLFDNVTAGNMLIHSVFSAINTLLNDSIAFTFGLKFVPG